MAEQMLREIGSVPTIADGNPSTLMAIEKSAHREGVVLEAFYLEVVSSVGRQFHKDVTSDPDRAAQYVKSSEIERAGAKGKAFGALSFTEFMMRAALQGDYSPTRWNVVQELPLMQASPRLLSWLGIVDIRLLAPDVHPKESGVIAVSKHPGAQISVWNQDAFDELTRRKISAALHKPYLLDGFRQETPQFYDEGMPIVAKVSGSGAPEHWARQLREALFDSHEPFAIHSPGYNHKNGHTTRTTSFQKRMHNFYRDLGGNTRLLIGYPSELVSVAAEMQARDVAMTMITLPPRGAHELKNLEFAWRHGIVIGELAVEGSRQIPTLADIPLVKPRDIAAVLKDVPKPAIEPGLLGEKSLWE